MKTKQKGFIELFLFGAVGAFLLVLSMAANANDDHVIPIAEVGGGSYWGNGGYDCDESGSGPTTKPPHCISSSDHGRRPEGQQEWN